MRLAFPSLCLVLGALACGGGESRVIAPETPGTTAPPPGGGVQRTTLNVTVRPEPPDLLIVRTLGWPDAIPGATVVLRREGGADMIARSDSQGVVTFVDLVEGNYQLTVTRSFSALELNQLAPADRDLSAWGGALSLVVGSAGGNMPAELTAGAVRHGSLVFSEVLSGGLITFQPNGTMYTFSGFLEFFNNADTTIALDGMLIAITKSPGRNYSAARCAMSRDLYADTAGVWADIIYQLPSIGRRLEPGGLIVIATDAIDHRSFGERDVYDLSRADYELYMGPGDVDNPAVPNLISVGTVQSHSAFTTHGADWLQVDNAVAVASRQNAAALERRLSPEQNHDYMLVPRSTILDIFSHFVEDARFPALCAPAVGANIDAAPYVLNSFTMLGTSFQRSSLPGSVLLRRSRSSARDFSVLTATPFTLP